jgi:4'-phosphopantetheinyl transferase
VQVWLIRTDQPQSRLAGLERLLDEAERQRAAELLSGTARRRFVVAHGAVRMIIGARVGMPPADLRWRYGPHGKPALAAPHDAVQVSLSRSGGLAALAISAGRAVGIDVQELPAGQDVARMAARFFPPDEARFVASATEPRVRVDRFVRLWARKEACLKVAGDRLMPGLKLPVMSGGQFTAAGQVVAGDMAGPLPGPYLVRDVAAPDGFGAAVAVAGTAAFAVLRRWWPDDGAG